MKRIICVLVILALLVTSVCADDLPDFTGWKQAETEHFCFVYEDASKEAAEAYAKIADEAWNKIAKVYSLPKEKITVRVMGRSNIMNAFTNTMNVTLGMYTTPFTITDFTFRDDWITYVFTHELIHAANASFEGRDNIMADLFGIYFHILDWQSINSWEHEGLTTVLETELTDAGRGRSPYFELLYKAPAMEGSLLSYDEIGKAEEPPRGQNYVYGYIMMRSIADRWGIDTFADFERNRAIQGSFESSVLSITGETAEDIYRDVKNALTTKYAGEQTIPEGKTITPRNSFYFRPAAILDDGTIIALRRTNGTKQEDMELVKLSPSLKSGQVYYESLKGGEATTKETVLIRGYTSDYYAATADKDGTVYISLRNTREDRAPGKETEYQIYKWKDGTLSQLTYGSSYFQPSVSRDGSMLVALEQIGLHFRLVKIDVETGVVTPVLEDSRYDFVMPSLNYDGSEVALLRSGGGRAAVAVYDLKKAAGVADASALTIVANGTGDIVDPTSPSWQPDGTLTYCSNDRGRLEIYQVTDEGNGHFSSKPMLSDPVGALWAYKTDNGIYYSAYASTGYVVKMKPASEWGVVPDWEGPSKPGEWITLDGYEESYKGFEPYQNADKIDFKKRDTDKWVNNETIKPPVTELQNEKRYTALPDTMLRIPTIALTELPGDKAALGVGGLWYGTILKDTDRDNMSNFLAQINYFPELTNFSFGFEMLTKIYNSYFNLVAERYLTSTKAGFSEINLLGTGLTTPFYNRSTPISKTDLSAITGVAGGVIRSDPAPFSVNANIPYTPLLTAVAGLTFTNESWNASKSRGFVINSSATGFLNYYAPEKKVYVGCEADFSIMKGDDKDEFRGIYIQGRYLDAPSDLQAFNSTMKHGGKKVDCSKPLNFVGRLEDVVRMDTASITLYEETLCSVADGTFTIDDVYSSGIEFVTQFQKMKITGGISLNYNSRSKKFSLGEFYVGARLNFFGY